MTESAGRRPRRWPGRLARSVFVAAMVGWMYFLVTLVQVDHAARSDGRRPADAIVVMGAAQYDGRPSRQLAARLDHAVTLYTAGVAPVVVVTGGNQPGDRFTEAGTSAQYLVDHGVPASAIVQEDEGRTTYQSLRSVADLLAERSVRSVVIVTDPYHALRARLIANEVGLVAVTSPTPSSVIAGTEQLGREVREALGVAVGRIIGFARLTRLVG